MRTQPRTPVSALALALVLTTALSACAPSADPVATTSSAASTDAAAVAAGAPDGSTAGAPVVAGGGMLPPGDVLRAVEVDRRPHDDTAFTQGLEFHDGRLFESRGLRAQDEGVILTEIDPLDGSAIREVPRPGGDDAFYEGLTVLDDRLIQLTWQAGTAYTYDLETLERTGQLAYDGEGWGICDQPDRLLMTNGTPTLTHRDPETFEVLDEVTVTLDGQPVDELNEVECIGDRVWANVWQTNRIVVIDPDSGEVVTEIDASAFADARGRYVGGGADVLNGIAYDEATGTVLLTGKLWPYMFEVGFTCVEGCDPVVTPSHYRRPTDRAQPAAG